MTDVFFHTTRASINKNLLDKVENLLEKIDMGNSIVKNQIMAVKLHFGEKGNSAFIRPIFVRKAIDLIKSKGIKTYLTDTNTLYRGSREDAATHIETAICNGFAYSVVNAPIVIADGIRGNDEIEVDISGKHFQSVPIGMGIVKADALLVLSHFKAHELTGFGGGVKNLGMGCSSRKGKLSMHSTVSPKINPKKCKGDGICEIACSFDAISMMEEKAVIDREKCTGCGVCLGVCPHLAINIKWSGQANKVAEKMAEFAYGAIKSKEGKCWYVNFVTQVSPACDCYGYSDSPIVPDIGIFASTDPVALDMACFDAVKTARGLPKTALKENVESGVDKFKALYPNLNPLAQLIHGEKIGLGNRKYNLIKLG